MGSSLRLSAAFLLDQYMTNTPRFVDFKKPEPFQDPFFPLSKCGFLAILCFSKTQAVLKQAFCCYGN